MVYVNDFASCTENKKITSLFHELNGNVMKREMMSFQKILKSKMQILAFSTFTYTLRV
jgi:hypothetical protein